MLDTTFEPRLVSTSSSSSPWAETVASAVVASRVIMVDSRGRVRVIELDLDTAEARIKSQGKMTAAEKPILRADISADGHIVVIGPSHRRMATNADSC